MYITIYNITQNLIFNNGFKKPACDIETGSISYYIYKYIPLIINKKIQKRNLKVRKTLNSLQVDVIVLIIYRKMACIYTYILYNQKKI